MNQMKRILLLVAMLTILTAHQAFAAVRETTKEPSTTPSSPSTAGSGTTDKTFNEPKDQSILSRLPEPPPTDKSPSQGPDAYAPRTQQGGDTTCVPPSPNCPEVPGSSSEVLPIYNICPSGYYCRASIIPVPGGKDATCTVNETELSDFYRDCAKVIEICRGSKPQDVGEVYQKICSL